MAKLAVLCLLVIAGSARGKFWTDCGSKMSRVQRVGVSGCAEDAKECILKRNTNATISVDFTPTQEISSIETEVHGVIMNLPVPFPLAQPDACKDTGLVCPLKAGEKASYKSTMPVHKSYPKVKVEIKWELKSTGGDLVCILIPAKIN